MANELRREGSRWVISCAGKAHVATLDATARQRYRARFVCSCRPTGAVRRWVRA